MKKADSKQHPELERFYDATFEHAPLPMAMVEGAGHIVRHVNPAFCRLLKRSREELVGKSFREILPEYDESVPMLAGVFRTG